MFDYFVGLKDTLSIAADVEALLIGGGFTLLSVAGAVPRLGLVSAIRLACKSYISFIRSYITVIGEKGNGKSCLIDTTLSRKAGVVKISTESGATKKAIVDNALCEITGFRLVFLDSEGSARRLLFFYSLLFKRSPIVVIRVPERLSAQSYADIPAAVRSLADDFGLRVIVDGSQNSIPPELLTTNRETVMVVEPMSKEQIESISEFKSLINVLKTEKLDVPVWKVLGGSPAKYLKLKEAIDTSRQHSSEDIENLVKAHLRSVLVKALTANIVKSSARTKELIKLFREMNVSSVPITEIEAKGLLLEYPNKVFREVDDINIEPANSLIITENIHDKAGAYSLLDKLLEEAKHTAK